MLGLRSALFELAGAAGARAGPAQTAAQAARAAAAAAGGAGASRRRRESQAQGVLVQSAAGEQGVAGRQRILQEAQLQGGSHAFSRGHQLEPQPGGSLAAPGRGGRKAQESQGRQGSLRQVSGAAARGQGRRRDPQEDRQPALGSFIHWAGGAKAAHSPGAGVRMLFRQPLTRPGRRIRARQELAIHFLDTSPESAVRRLSGVMLCSTVSSTAWKSIRIAIDSCDGNASKTTGSPAGVRKAAAPFSGTKPADFEGTPPTGLAVRLTAALAGTGCTTGGAGCLSRKVLTSFTILSSVFRRPIFRTTSRRANESMKARTAPPRIQIDPLRAGAPRRTTTIRPAAIGNSSHILW